jgi:BlaI family transcriptional regulator, penicillinase repressor
MPRRKVLRLSPLEHEVMNDVWDRAVVTADDVRAALARSRPMKDSTVRTILRRLEAKDFVEHTVEGRTFHYSSKVAPQNVASHAVRGIIERFCAGSVETLLVGMVDSDVVSADTLKGLADKIAKAENRRGPSPFQESAEKEGTVPFSSCGSQAAQKRKRASL